MLFESGESLIMIDWPRDLIDDISRRRAILFLGAGISKNAVSRRNPNVRPPLWSEFLDIAVQRCKGSVLHIKRMIKSGDFLTACEIIKHRLDDEWNSIVHELFVEPEFSHAKIHKTIFSLDCRIVLTQNVDKIYDVYAASESQGTVYVKEYSKIDVGLVVRGDRWCVLKAHGTVDSPAEMVFTREEYSTARARFFAFYSILDALAVTHTIVFLGCGASDPDVQLMLERQAALYPCSRPHYMVSPVGRIHTDVAQCYKRSMNLRVLTYKPDDSHSELSASLEELLASVEIRRFDLASQRDW